MSTLIVDVAQSANVVFAGPASGSAALPTFRALTSADVTSGGVLTFTAVAAPSVPATGNTWLDSTQKSLRIFTDGVSQSFNTTIFTQTAAVTLATSTAATTLFGAGKGMATPGPLTLPANFFVAGKTVRVRGFGVLSTTGTPTFNLLILLGATTITSTGTVTTDSGASNVLVSFDVTIVCRQTGPTATISGGGIAQFGTKLGSLTVATVKDVDTTISQILDVQGQWGTSSASNTVTINALDVTVLN